MENIVVTSTSSSMFDYAYKYIGDKTKLIFQATSMHGSVLRSYPEKAYFQSFRQILIYHRISPKTMRNLSLTFSDFTTQEKSPNLLV
jgi:hypothetical protein